MTDILISRLKQRKNPIVQTLLTIIASYQSKNSKQQEELVRLKTKQQAKQEIIKDKNTPSDLLSQICNKQYEKQKLDNVWIDSSFQKIDKLKCDYVGKIGELWCDNFCKNNHIDCKYIEDKNTKDGTYDIKIQNKKIEIKTARQEKQKTFQHENLHQRGYDYLCFLDISPVHFYFTILPRFNMKSKREIFGKTLHRRKNTSNVFKFDFSNLTIKNAIKAGKCLKIDSTTSSETVKIYSTINYLKLFKNQRSSKIK